MSKKAVLIFDMPESCADCPCCYDFIDCTAMSESLIDSNVNTIDGPLPDWCPLIEVSKDYIRRAEIHLNRIKYAKEDRL